MESTSGINLLPVILAFLGILIAGWLYLRTWPDSKQLSGRHHNAGAMAPTPIHIDQLDQASPADDNHGSVAWRPDAILVLDQKLKLNWANRIAENWFGINAHRSFGEKITDLLEPGMLRRYLQAGDFDKLLDCIAPGASDLSIRIRVTPCHQSQLLLQARDISQIKALELVRRDFVANASHELRTPVSVLYGYLGMMMQEHSTGINPDWQPAIRQMHEQTERVKKIIEDMLLLSRLEESDSRDEHDYIELTPLLKSACRDAKVLGAGKNHQIRLDIDKNCSLLCNKDEIESLVSNLVSNAVRYTPDNGTITVQWKFHADIGRLCVIDTGIGIAGPDIPRVIERFYRSDLARSRETGGTGLGLAIANHIIQRHQASLEIESEPDQGSTFTVNFPAQRIRKNQGQVGLLLN